MSRTDANGHIVELQSLRGFAAMAVVVGHALAFYQQPQWFGNGAVLFNGRAAVVLFFVLSGFVLTQALRAAVLDSRDLLKFYIRRVFRIYPAMWVVSILGLFYLIFLHWNVPAPDTSEFFRARFRADRMDLLHITASFAGMLAFIIPQLWSIFVEIIASAAMPFIAYAVRHKRTAFYVAAGAALVASFVIGSETYYAVGLYALDFFVGAWLAAAEWPRRMFSRVNPSLVKPMMVVIVICMMLTLHLPVPYYDPRAAFLEMILATGLIGLVAHSGVVVRLLRRPSVLFLGDISYSLYLTHFLVACLWVKAIAVFRAASGVQIDLSLQAVILAVLTMATTIPVSWLLYETVEKRGIVIGKFVAARMARSSQIAAQA